MIRHALAVRYAEPWRFYHTLEHIDALLNLLDIFDMDINRPDIVRQAIIYHDAIYIPGAPHGQNEEFSARLAEGDLVYSGTLNAADAALVAKYIRATTHDPDPVIEDNDLKYFLDFDLCGLGAPWSRYKQNGENVLREYRTVFTDEQIEAGRIAFLRSMFNRRNIYHTEQFRSMQQPNARANIKREWLSLEPVT